MRKIGTISSAAGFIFLGLWMIINQKDAVLGSMIFKWWPLIIIILGIEILMSFNRREENQRLRLNGLIIPVILIFLFVNLFVDAKLRIGEGLTWLKNSKNFNEVIDILKNIDDTNYKVIEATKVIDSQAKSFVLNTNNADVKLIKSTDDKVKLSCRVYIKRDRDDNAYDIKEKKEGDSVRVDFNESFIKKIQVDLSVPDGMNVKFDVNNLKITSDADLPKITFDVKSNNIYADIISAESVKFDANNGKIDLRNIKEITVKSNNAMINVEGDSENVKLNANNGMITVDNNLSKNVNIEMSSGTVKMKTTDQNVNVKLNLDHGTCNLNDDRKVNSGLSKSFGSGEGKINIKVDNGIINFSN